jgi:electron transfer flavoprotein alpha subunit
LEAVSAGRKIADVLGDQLLVSVIGPAVDGTAETLAKYGADKVVIAQGANYFEYNQEVHSEVLKAMVEKYNVNLVLLSATTTGKDLGPRLAAKLDAGFASDCSELLVEGDRVYAVRPVYAGKAYVKVSFKTTIALATLRPKLFLAAEAPRPVLKEEFSFIPPSPKAIIKGIEAKEAGEIDLTEADVIVSGGRGVKGPEGFIPVRELAKALNGVVGASRAAVDAGWIEHRHQVGQTGKTVNPEIYFALGISGAIQHIAGMRNSKVIVAINRDPDAPIFKIANYGVVGDLFKVVPALIEELKK